MTERILVVGGLGYLGSALLRVLGSHFDVVCVDVKAVNCQDSMLKEIPWQSIKSFRKVIWLATTPSGDVSASKRMSIELLPLLQLLEAMKPGSKIVFASSVSVYGVPVYVPVDELHPKSPNDEYSLLKSLAEDAIIYTAKSMNIVPIILRLTSLYGPGHYATWSRARAIPLFVRLAILGEPLKILGFKHEVRDYLYMEDAVAAIIQSVASDCANGIYNISSEEGIEVLQLAELVVRCARSKSRIIGGSDGVAPSFVYSARRAKAEFGFSPQTSLCDGITREVEYRILEEASWDLRQEIANAQSARSRMNADCCNYRL